MIWIGGLALALAVVCLVFVHLSEVKEIRDARRWLDNFKKLEVSRRRLRVAYAKLRRVRADARYHVVRTTRARTQRTR